MLHRTAQVKEGHRAVIIGASGGVGTALLDLGRLAKIKMYGLASKNKHSSLREYGAVPIDYRTEDFVEVLRRAEPEGVDFAFDGMGGSYIERALTVIRRGGKVVEYGAPTGAANLVGLLLKIAGQNLSPNGKRVQFYGVTSFYRLDKRPYMEDLPVLFGLLAEGKIQPVIAGVFPLVEARKANELLESGSVTGNLVLKVAEV